jgi:hypothetical protein
MGTAPATTFQRPYRHLGVRLFNGAGRLLRAVGLRRPLRAESILQTASRQTGLSDWGSDESFREGLERLVQSCEEDCRLTPLGRALLRHAFILHARTRLRLQEWIKREPSILNEQIHRPLFVVGYPRTGTTLLHNLLCQDRRGRPLLLWEALEPVPPPDFRLGLEDPRIDRARWFVFLVGRYLLPQMAAIHPLDAEGPEECTFLLLNTLRTPAYTLVGDLRGYHQWLRDRGERERLVIYQEYRRQLQFLQWRRPGRYWILKSPLHIWALDALLRLFPDALVVQTHRDMSKVIASTWSLKAVSRTMYSDHVDPPGMHEEVYNYYQDFHEPMTKARAAHPGRVFDLHYRDLVRDPLAAVRSIHEHFGMTPDKGTEERVRQWVAHHPANKHGIHRYDLAQFGLMKADIEKLYRDYHEQYGIKPEASGV